jgi:hypothetical protein
MRDGFAFILMMKSAEPKKLVSKLKVLVKIVVELMPLSPSVWVGNRSSRQKTVVCK